MRDVRDVNVLSYAQRMKNLAWCGAALEFFYCHILCDDVIIISVSEQKLDLIFLFVACDNPFNLQSNEWLKSYNQIASKGDRIFFSVLTIEKKSFSEKKKYFLFFFIFDSK